jgi:signal transduction histidine kinase
MELARDLASPDRPPHARRTAGLPAPLPEPLPIVTRPPVPETPVAEAVAEALAQERDRVHAWLHDSVLQVLELIAAGGYSDTPDPAMLSRLAAGAARELRSEIEGRARVATTTLTGVITRAVARERARGPLAVRLEVGQVEEIQGAEASLLELSDAVAEALRNAAKHSGAGLVTIRYELVAGIATVVVSDDGVGFDQEARATGSGLSKSIVGRLRRAGGWATIDSSPGGGTRIMLVLRLAGAGPLTALSGSLR